MPYECGGLHALPPSTLVQLNDAAKFIVQHLADLSLEQIDPKLRSIYCVLFNIKNPGHGLLVSLLKVRESEERSDELTAKMLATRTVQAWTSVQDALP